MTENAPKAQDVPYLTYGSQLNEKLNADTSKPAGPGAVDIPAQRTDESLPFSTPLDVVAEPDPSSEGRTPPDIDPAIATETFYTDVEILGKHYPVRQLINEIGNQRMQAVENVTAAWKNVLDTPGKMRLGIARSIAEGRLNRQQAKADRVSHLSDRNFLKQRRMRKLRKAKERFKRADARYNGRKDRMKARKENVGLNVEKRRNAYRKELRVRREAALGRRALRHELRAQDAGRIEARIVLKDIPKEHLDRVGKLAAVAHASERQATRARKNEAAHEKRQSQTESTVADNRKRATEAASEAKKANDIVEELKTSAIPKAKASLQSLRDNLEKLENDDPAHTTLQLQIQETEERIAIHEREAAYWSQVALSNRERVITLDKNHMMLTQYLGWHQAATQTAATSATAAHSIANAHADALAKATKEATESAPELNN